MIYYIALLATLQTAWIGYKEYKSWQYEKNLW